MMKQTPYQKFNSKKYIFTGFERPAESEGVPGHGLRAGAHRGKTAEVAFSVVTASVGAGVDTRVVHASWLKAGAFAIRGALS